MLPSTERSGWTISGDLAGVDNRFVLVASGHSSRVDFADVII